MSSPPPAATAPGASSTYVPARTQRRHQEQPAAALFLRVGCAIVVETFGCAHPYGPLASMSIRVCAAPCSTSTPRCCPGLDEIEDDLQARRSRAAHEGWLGEVEGLDLTLTFLRQNANRRNG